jgi:YHS domain-containing protein
MHHVPRRRVVRLLLLAAAFAFAPLGPPIAGEQAPLAIRGYDPVAYFTVGAPVRGLPQLEYEWDEHRYRFSRPENRELFKADPARYAPQFADLCAMALTRGEVHEANPEYWLISGGKLYIFGNRAGPQRFEQDLKRNVARANENRPTRSKR